MKQQVKIQNQLNNFAKHNTDAKTRALIKRWTEDSWIGKLGARAMQSVIDKKAKNVI